MPGETANQPNTAHSAAPSLGLHHVMLACIGRLLFAEEGVEPLGAEQAYLFDHYQAVRPLGDPAQLLAQCLAGPAAADEALFRLARVLRLSRPEILALTLALMVEEEPMTGRVLAHLQAPVGGSRPTLGLLEAALAPVAEGSWLTGELLGGPAVASGALQILDAQAPLPERSLRMPLGLALAVRGKPLAWPGVSLAATEQTLRLPPTLRQQIDQQARALRHDAQGLLVIRSASAEEARAVAVALAAQLHRTPLFIDEDVDLAGLGAACLVLEALPVFVVAGDVAAKTLPSLPAYNGPRLALCGPDTPVTAARGSVVQWSLGLPSRSERADLWQAYLGEEALARQLAQAHIHSAGRIAELSRLALREARRLGHERPSAKDVRQAAWTAEAGQLASLARPVSGEIPDEALVVTKAVAEELQQLVARCQVREDLDRSLGVTLRARYRPGVRGLLVGPSGTGKTLAAGWLATRLGLPLYRVDLAAVVSKYIGETEKNLADLLARAEHSEIVLLFDEADSLFGKRTDVKDANDRFANSQTNYLLQRIESYRGIVLLTSNSRERFDSAFTRRLDKIIEFPLPTPQERRALWQVHLGEGHALGVEQINRIAVASDLAGGHIRNAVLAAAVAATEAGRPIAMADVLLGLEGEYRKLGRQFPAELRRCAAEAGDA